MHIFLFVAEAFRQQRLRAWQPILRPRKFIPFIFLLALIFVPFGALLIAAAANVRIKQAEPRIAH